MGRVVDQEWENGNWHEVTQFDLLKKFSSQFVAKTPRDLIGITAFARAAQVISPLTLDHITLQEQLGKLTVIKDPAQDGTAMGYAIYKTAHLITALEAYKDADAPSPYDIKGAVMILITDGLQDPSLLDRGNRLRSMDLEEAGDYARKNNIHLYIVHVGTVLNEERFAPNKREIEKLVQNTGGQLIISSDLEKLDDVLTNIHKLERSRIYSEAPPALKKVSLYPYLLLMGLACIGISIVLNTSLWRRVA
jgi:Ca-activated chloride channel family protein